MLEKVKNFIEENNLIIDEPIICATSGGVDSICMLHLFCDLGYKVVLAHVNHHKREESEIEQQAMQNLAESLGIPFELLEYYYDGSDNFHNDSHHARYAFFKELCNKYQTRTIATAHHLDDQIETVLMKILEGSNLYGYGGISVCNDDGVYRIIRPLLCVNKQELYEYAEERNYVFFEDGSNDMNDFLRNRIRHFIVPLLKNECKDLYSKIMEFSFQIKEAFHYIRQQSINYLDERNNKIDIHTFSILDIAVKKDIISLLFERYNISKNNQIILNVLELLQQEKGTKRISLEGEYELVRSYATAYIKKKECFLQESVYIDLNREGIFNGKYKFYFSKKIPDTNAKYIKLCYNNLELPFCIRNKRDGDSIHLPIGNKKISRVFVDSKISLDLRDKTPIIVDAKGTILWVYNIIKSQEVLEQKDSPDIYFVCEEL